MTTEQIIKAYKDKENTPCPITNKLVMAGYQQEKDGYIDYAAECGLEIDYTKALPTQYWHLLKSYCDKREVTFALDGVNNKQMIAHFVNTGINLYAGKVYSAQLSMNDIIKTYS